MPVFANHAAVREASQPEVYVLCDGIKVWVPTDDARFHMGYQWANVQVGPDGSLAGYPRRDIRSLSKTPPSMAYPMHISDHKTKWWPRTELPSITLPTGTMLARLKVS